MNDYFPYYSSGDIPLKRPTKKTAGQIKFHGYMKTNGPTEHIIPSHSYLSCTDCVYYKSKLWCSGRDPVYARSCTHPESAKEHPLGHLGNLPDEDRTPDWCPLKLDIKKTPKKEIDVDINYDFHEGRGENNELL